MSEQDNPFLGLAHPPQGNDAEAQLTYLKQVIDAFDHSGNPRVRPLGRRLDEALTQLARSSQRGTSPEQLARQFAAEVLELRQQAFELLLTVINQVRGTLRVKSQQGVPAPKRADTEKLQKALAMFSQALRKTLTAVKKGDGDAQKEADKMLAEAGTLLEESGHELSAG